jgi:hypothetical protein
MLKRGHGERKRKTSPNSRQLELFPITPPTSHKTDNTKVAAWTREETLNFLFSKSDIPKGDMGYMRVLTGEFSKRKFKRK